MVELLEDPEVEESLEWLLCRHPHFPPVSVLQLALIEDWFLRLEQERQQERLEG